MKILSSFILKIIGWKITGKIPENLKKYVLIAAPHTSNWDFVIGRLGLYYLGVKNLKVMIKKEFFFFPLNFILKAFGAIPIDRGHAAPMVNSAIKWFKKYNNMALLITPEGTRKLNPKWKKGFYFIASEANVPIVCCYIDYAKKEGGIGPIFYPTGKYEDDFKIIENFYKNITPKFPEKFNLYKTANTD